MGRIIGSSRYANVTSTLALVIAVGGSGAYAASTIRSHDIRNGEVKAVDVANGAITSAKVRDGSLRRADFRPGELPASPAGSAGPTGATSQAGPGGSLPDLLASGSTLRGAYAFSGIADTFPADGDISFPIALANPPIAEVVRRNAASTANCPGSVASPTAAPGYLCVYESAISDNDGLTAFSPETGVHGAATRYGVGLFITAPSGPASNNKTSKGSWAVTAP